MATGKTIALTIRALVSKVMSLLFNMLSRFLIAFLQRSKHLIISWLQSPSTVISKPKKIKSVNVSIVSPSICHEVMELGAIILVYWMLSFKLAFSLSSFTLIKRLFSSSSLSVEWYHLWIWGCWYFSQQSWLQLVIHPAFHMMYYAYKLNKQGDNIQPCCIPFSILNQSVVPCTVRTIASWPAYRILRRQVR